jgi:elongation factor P--(R)-beta-lysine ligase
LKAVSDSADWETAFNQVFVTLVEPALPTDAPLALTEYPAQIECLARRIPGKPYRERWELYAGGMELANCYAEERDLETIRSYFETQGAAKTGMKVPHPVDSEYWRIFERFPPCSGVAMGLDRLLAIMLGKRYLSQVMYGHFSSFPGIDSP